MIIDSDFVRSTYTALAPVISFLQVLVGVRLITKVVPIKDGAAKILLILLSLMITVGAVGNIAIIACRNVMRLPQSTVLYISVAVYVIQLFLLGWTAYYMSLIKGTKGEEGDV